MAASRIINDTFRIGSNIIFNTCIEGNSHDIDTYEYGYDSGTKKLMEAITNDFEESLIFPILFMARHCIELFLKRNIQIMEKCYVVKNKREKNKEQIQKIHDLEELWKWLKNLCSIDRRLEKRLSDIEPYIVDYFPIDLTGQAFRYPSDLRQEDPSDNLYCINLSTFKKRYLELSGKMEQINYMTVSVLYEYEQGTFTDHLSRYDIEKISRKLPPYSEWDLPSFEQIRNDLEQRYSLSSNEFSKAINIIKNHREFSVNVGILNKVKEIDEKDTLFWLVCYKDFETEEKPSGFGDTKMAVIKKISNQLNPDAISAWLTFHKIGYCDYYGNLEGYEYSESYDRLLHHFKKQGDLPTLVSDNLFNSRKDLLYVKRGMGKCGQTHLTAVFQRDIRFEYFLI